MRKSLWHREAGQDSDTAVGQDKRIKKRSRGHSNYIGGCNGASRTRWRGTTATIVSVRAEFSKS